MQGSSRLSCFCLVSEKRDAAEVGRIRKECSDENGKNDHKNTTESLLSGHSGLCFSASSAG